MNRTLKGTFQGFSPNKKCDIPKYEDCVDGRIYAFTFSPDDSGQYWHEEKADLRMIRFLDYYNTFFCKHLDDVSRYFLRIEISPQGRLHFHGYLQILNKLRFYLVVIRNLKGEGIFEIDTIESIKKWNEYITKQGFDTYDKILNNCTYRYICQEWMQDFLCYLTLDECIND